MRAKFVFSWMLLFAVFSALSRHKSSLFSFKSGTGMSTGDQFAHKRSGEEHC